MTSKTKPQDYKTLGESVDDKLFFAGEHTSVAYRATVHGAYLSGLEAAKSIYEI
jgi:monoamine oxidase